MRPTVRVRLTAIYAAVLVLSTAALLGASYVLLGNQLDRTLPEDLADAALHDVGRQYVIGLVGATLVAVALGWALAGRVLAPLSHITATARRVSDERLDTRIALGGPRDELRELADTVDAMLDRLEEAFGTQRRFVANASHELRSPLTVIRTEAEVALADPDAPREELRAALEAVVEGADRTEALLEALLLLARSHRGVVRREPVDLAAAARAAADALEREAAARDVVVRLETTPAPAAGDPPLLERLAANLVDNAVRYNRPGGSVDVRTHVAGGRAVLEVSNDGPLLAGADVARLTQPFERLGRRAGAGGSGLGLSIVASVVEAHGGTLDLASRPAGGLDVRVVLPGASSRPTGSPERAARPAGTAGPA
jgi:signal transduction histidine kinase